MFTIHWEEVVYFLGTIILVGFEQHGPAVGRVSNQPSGLLLRAQVPTSRNVYRGDFRFCRIVLYDAAFFMPKKLWQTVPGSEP